MPFEHDAFHTRAPGKLQSYYTWTAAIAVIGHLCNAYGWYDLETGTNFACMIEAVTGCIGETAMCLWQICLSITLVMTLHDEWFHDRELQSRLLIGYHVFVWTLSLGSTIVPWSQGMRCVFLISSLT